MNSPLSFSPIAVTTSAEETEHLFQRELIGSRILNVKKGEDIGVGMNGVALGNSSLSFIRHLSDYEIDCGEVDTDGTVIFGIGFNQPSFTSINGKKLDVTEDAVVIANRAAIKHLRSKDSCEVVFKCTAGDVAARLQTCLNRTVSREINYASSVPLDHGIGAHAQTSLLYVVKALDADPSLLGHPLIMKNFEELLMGVILSLPSNFSEEISAPSGTSFTPACVSRAEEYIEANSGLPITIADILLHVGCSRKTLFADFRKFRGYSPGDFLANERLKQAHERLSEASESDSVTSIACESGFSHLGRFSEVYRKRYGVLPSETLKRALHR